MMGMHSLLSWFSIVPKSWRVSCVLFCNLDVSHYEFLGVVGLSCDLLEKFYFWDWEGAPIMEGWTVDWTSCPWYLPQTVPVSHSASTILLLSCQVWIFVCRSTIIIIMETCRKNCRVTHFARSIIANIIFYIKEKGFFPRKARHR